MLYIRIQWELNNVLKLSWSTAKQAFVAKGIDALDKNSMRKK